MITVNDLKNRDNFFLMAGPCAIEGEDMALRIAEKVVGITNKLNIPYIQRIIPESQPFSAGFFHRHWR